MKKRENGLRPAGRYRYTENYALKTEIRPDGSAVRTTEYIGPQLIPEHSETFYRSVRVFARRSTLLTACALLLLLGIQNFSVYQGGLYVFIPITAAVFPELYLTMGLRRLPASDKNLRQDTWQLAHRRIRRSALGICILMGIAAMLFLLFLLSGGEWQSIDGLFALLLLLPAVGNGILVRQMGRLKYTEEAS